MSVSHVNSRGDLGTELSTPKALVRYYTTKNKNASCQNGDYSFKIHESHAEKYRCRQSLWLCGIRDEIKIIHVDSWCWLKEGLTEQNKKNNHVKQPLLLPLRVWWLAQANISRLYSCQRRCRIFHLKDSWLLPLCWMYCVRCICQDDKHTLFYSPSWQTVYFQHTACCFMSESKLHVDCSILISRRLRLARIKSGKPFISKSRSLKNAFCVLQTI